MSTSAYNAEGIVYDTIRNKLYFSEYDNIYRCNADDGSNIETVFTSQCKET